MGIFDEAAQRIRVRAAHPVVHVDCPRISGARLPPFTAFERIHVGVVGVILNLLALFLDADVLPPF